MRAPSLLLPLCRAAGRYQTSVAPISEGGNSVVVIEDSEDMEMEDVGDEEEEDEEDEEGDSEEEEDEDWDPSKSTPAAKGSRYAHCGLLSDLYLSPLLDPKLYPLPLPLLSALQGPAAAHQPAQRIPRCPCLGWFRSPPVYRCRC